MKKIVFLIVLVVAVWANSQETADTDAYNNSCSYRMLAREVKQYILADNPPNQTDILHQKITSDHDFSAEIIALRQRYHSAYPPILLQIDVNEFCNRWQLCHIQLFKHEK